MVVRFSTAAQSDAREAAYFYEQEVEGLGKAFFHELGSGIQTIKQHPLASRVIHKDYRRHLIQRFPFGIIYKIENETILVLAIMHLRRKPGYWLKDTP